MIIECYHPPHSEKIDAGWIINLEDAIGTVAFGATRIGNSLAPQWLAEWEENHWYDPVLKLK